MVKRSSGGTKRKAKMEKIANKNFLSTAFSKRSYGLYSKISQLCLLSDAQIAVLATPPSSNSNVSFFSFGHSSVDAIVSAYLTGQSPIVSLSVKEEETREDVGICMARKELGLGFWWEDDELLARTKINPDELMEAINSMLTLLRKFEIFHSGEEAHKSQTHHETLTLTSDDVTTNLTGSLEQEMEDIDQLIDFNSFETSDVDALFNDNDKSDLPDKTLNSPMSCIRDYDFTKLSNFNEIVEEQTEPDQTLDLPTPCCIRDDLSANMNDMTEDQSQILAFCERFCEETVDDLSENSRETTEEEQRRFLEIYESLWV